MAQSDSKLEAIMSTKVIILRIFITFFLVHYAECKFNMTEYYQMPPLFKFDDYERCLQEFSPDRRTTYCVARTTILPNPDSSSWKAIEKFSVDRKFTYHHEILERGLCVHLCEDAISEWNVEVQANLYLENFDGDSIAWPPKYFPNTLAQREEYGKLINRCVNLELWKNHNLSGYSEILFCHSSDDKHEKDYLVTIFYIITATILGLNILSTLYDYFKRDPNSDNHFQAPLKDKSKMWLVIFSVPRNWHKLIAPANDDLSKDLKFIDGLRFIGIVSMVYAHTIFSLKLHPSANPQAIEEHLQRTSATRYEGVQLFFTISSFLVSVMFMQFISTSKKRPNVNFIWVAIFDRFIRLTPVYAFMMLIQASVFKHLVLGAMMKGIYAEDYNCRNNWWINLFYLNNYIKTDQPCIQQSWYLATDFQLYILVIITLYLIWKYPNSTVKILASLVSVAYVIVALVTYFGKFNGSILITLDGERYFMWFEDNYRINYLPGHMNTGCSLIGIVGGIIFYRLRENKVDIMKYKCFRILWYINAPFTLYLGNVTKQFYMNDYETPSIWMSAFAAFYRHIYGWSIIVIIIGLGLSKKSFIKCCLSHRIFKPLAKISYCIFLCHIFAINMANQNYNTTVIYNRQLINAFYLMTMVICLALGATLCLCIEMPTSSIYKTIKMKLMGSNSGTAAAKTKNVNNELNKTK